MTILVSAFPRGGSTFTGKAIAQYLGYELLNEPECSDGRWRHGKEEPFEERINLNVEYNPTEKFSKGITTPNMVVKTNYYTRILHLLNLPEDLKIIFVLRNPIEWATSSNRWFKFEDPHTLYLKRTEFIVDNQTDPVHYLMDTWIDIVNSIIDFSKTRSCLMLRFDTYVSNPAILKSKLDKFLGTDNEMHNYVADLKSYPEDDYRKDEINELWKYIDEYKGAIKDE